MRGVLIASAALVAFLCGCQSYTGPFVHKTEEELEKMDQQDALASLQFAQGRYGMADSTVSDLVAERTVSSPQYELEHISILLMQGKSDEAHALMMKVREEWETLLDPEAEKAAQSIWHGENNKVFKGDAHERATLYAFLALSFMERGAWEDAERCVKNGLLADSTNAENTQYNSDYALLHYLGSVACRKAGRLIDADAYVSQMKDALSARGVRTDAGSSLLGLLAKAPAPDAFVVAWIGVPPQYIRSGEYEEVRQPVRGSVPFSFVAFEVDGAGLLVAPQHLGDVNWQALTRGGREMDGVLAHKAAVKSGMRASRNFFLVAGYNCIGTVSSNPIAEAIILGAGGTCLALGGVCHLVGQAVNSRADIRCWRNLPGELVVMPIVMKGDKAEVIARGYNASWDNTALGAVTVQRRPGGMGVRHMRLWLNRMALEAMAGEKKMIDAFQKVAETSTDMAYEIKTTGEGSSK